MSLQIAVLKVLSSYPAGKASLVDLKNDLAILTTSGPDWTTRMRRLAARAPTALDVFSAHHVERDAAGWWITASGRAFLEAIERPAPPAAAEPTVIELVAAEPPRPASPPLTIVGRRDRMLRRRRQSSVQRLSA